jgi:hypothetical protein
MLKYLYIHVGLRKTATTWLQNIVFKDCSLNYLGKTEDSYPEWLLKWHYLDDYAFEKEKNNIRDILYTLLKPDIPTLISSEAFTNTGVIYNQALRIKDIYPDTRIIITLRDPVALLKSHYKHDVADGQYFMDLVNYLDWERTPFDLLKRKPIYLPDFYFNENIDYYQELFGFDNVCLLKYEDMNKDPFSFFEKLGDFLGIHFYGIDEKLKVKLNEGIAEVDLKMKKVTNFKEYLQLHFPNIFDTIKEVDFVKDFGSTIIDRELEEKLKEYFRGKCYGYY